ncbi:MAG: hypothetical protein AXW14_00770 [Alteromonas sp. Nap_26]|nr:MAG: hypothetical protein AXW14_00770 [Alteromonas sp. Nap_26]
MKTFIGNINTVIFDMDGTLIDSEPFWALAEKSVFSALGVVITDVLARQTAVMTTDEVTKFWFARSPWEGKDLQQVESDVISNVSELIGEYGTAMKGVQEILSFFKQRNFNIGLATNAPECLIPAVLDKLNITDYFDCVCSSENEIAGKPEPHVYNTVLRKLGASANNSIAFEDSVSGVIAAQSAGLKTVVIPPLSDYDNPKFDKAELKLKSLIEFSESELQKLN